MQKPAFSTIELMVTIIVIMIIMASLVPAITKKLNTRSVNIGGTIGTSNSNIEFEPDCSHINSDCELCTIDTCMLCLKICPTGQYAKTSDCTCKPCSDIFPSDCIACTNKKCKKCDSDTKYIDNNTCTICPIGSYCDSINKITCEEGKYTDTEGQTSCIDCEVGYKCTGGIKTPCEEGYYNSSTNQSSCLPCEKGYKCPGASDKIQCTGNQYQDETTQSTCKTCTTEGYYITDDRSSCTICEAGYYCPGNGTKTQCPAGTYSQAGAKECIPCAKGTYSTTAGATDVTMCTTCPKGYYCTGGSNKTSCGAGKYLDTTGNDASSDCKTCASKTANCTACDLTTGACSACADGYILSGTSCNVACGDELTMKLTLNGKEVCMMKYNTGEDAVNSGVSKGSMLVFPSSITKVNAGQNCATSDTKLCCWVGTTSVDCNSNNGSYSGCNRTLCDWRSAGAYCANLTYLNKTWRLPTNDEWSAVALQLSDISIGKGDNGIMLCDGNGASSTKCYTSDRCLGTPTGGCNIADVWSSNTSGSGANIFNLRNDVLKGPGVYSKLQAESFRCVADL